MKNANFMLATDKVACFARPHAQYLEEGVLCGHLGVLCDKCLKGYYEGVQPALVLDIGNPL